LDIALWSENLKKALGPPFAAYQCTVRLGKGTRWKRNFRLNRRIMAKMVKHHNVFCLL
jgi:hypothetical protein